MTTIVLRRQRVYQYSSPVAISTATKKNNTTALQARQSGPPTILAKPMMCTV
jgi:hypothetical protein